MEAAEKLAGSAHHGLAPREGPTRKDADSWIVVYWSPTCVLLDRAAFFWTDTPPSV